MSWVIPVLVTLYALGASFRAVAWLSNPPLKNRRFLPGLFLLYAAYPIGLCWPLEVVGRMGLDWYRSTSGVIRPRRTLAKAYAKNWPDPRPLSPEEQEAAVLAWQPPDLEKLAADAKEAVAREAADAEETKVRAEVKARRDRMRSEYNRLQWEQVGWPGYGFESDGAPLTTNEARRSVYLGPSLDRPLDPTQRPRLRATTLTEKDVDQMKSLFTKRRP
jgi:hypothetical protein